MFSSPESQKLIKEFTHHIKLIDNNIASFSSSNNINQSSLNEISHLISSASLTLAKFHNTLSSEADRSLLTSKFSELEARRKQLASISHNYKKKILSKVSENQTSSDINKLKNDKYIDVGLTTDYNEKLLQGSMSNLNEVNLNLQETALHLHNQGESLKQISDTIDKGDQNLKEGGRKIDEVVSYKKSHKIWLIVINGLLLLIIILLLIKKILNYIKG